MCSTAYGGCGSQAPDVKSHHAEMGSWYVSHWANTTNGDDCSASLRETLIWHRYLLHATAAC